MSNETIYVHPLNDFNGDGKIDLGAYIVNEDGLAEYQGVSYNPTVDATNPSNWDVTFTNLSPVSGLYDMGDVNGDGYDDVVAHTSTELVGFYGRPGGWTPSIEPDFIFTGNESPVGLTSIGDINGDGYDDIVSYENDGTIALVYGDPSTLSGENPVKEANAYWTSDVWYGSQPEISGLGDINGDGYDDIVAIDNLGTSILYGSPTMYTGENPDLPLIQIGDFMGLEPSDVYAVNGIGDVNADGYDDVFVDTWGNNQYVILGRPDTVHEGENITPGITLSSQDPIYQFFDLGDINGDGYDDIAIRPGGGSNNLHLLYGSSSLESGINVDALPLWSEMTPVSYTPQVTPTPNQPETDSGYDFDLGGGLGSGSGWGDGFGSGSTWGGGLGSGSGWGDGLGSGSTWGGGFGGDNSWEMPSSFTSSILDTFMPDTSSDTSSYNSVSTGSSLSSGTTAMLQDMIIDTLSFSSSAFHSALM